MSDETMMVQPVRTFLEGRELMTPESEPFPVSRSHWIDLQGAGLVVEHVAPVAQEPAPAAEMPPAEPEAPKRRGRPPRRS